MKQNSRTLSFDSVDQGFAAYFPLGAEVKRGPFKTVALPKNNSFQEILPTFFAFGVSGKATIPFLASHGNTCIQGSLRPPEISGELTKDCLLSIPKPRSAKVVLSSGTTRPIIIQDHEEPISSLISYSQQNLEVPWNENMKLKVGPMGGELIKLTLENPTVVNVNNTIKPQTGQRPKPATKTTETQFLDSDHGVSYRVLSDKPLHHFESLWSGYKQRNKGPQAFLFPRFIRYKFPDARLELKCPPQGFSSFEMIMLTRRSEVYQLDLDSCQSLNKREEFLELYGKLHQKRNKATKLKSLISTNYKLENDNGKYLGQVSGQDSYTLTFEIKKKKNQTGLNLKIDAEDNASSVAVRVIDEYDKVHYWNNEFPVNEEVTHWIKFKRKAPHRWVRIEVIGLGQTSKRLLTTPFIRR